MPRITKGTVVSPPHSRRSACARTPSPLPIVASANARQLAHGARRRSRVGEVAAADPHELPPAIATQDRLQRRRDGAPRRPQPPSAARCSATESRGLGQDQGARAPATQPFGRERFRRATGCHRGPAAGDRAPEPTPSAVRTQRLERVQGRHRVGRGPQAGEHDWRRLRASHRATGTAAAATRAALGDAPAGASSASPSGPQVPPC
jgi:hypothetical protein